jgi:hypothetical protein
MRLSPLFWSGLITLSLSGCAGYKLGPTNGQRSGARSIQINPFVNATPEARLSEAVTSSLRKNLQQDGTYRLNTDNAGDIIVSGTIMELDRSHVSLQPNDTLTPRDYRISITAQITARERTSGKVILNRKVAGHSTLRVGSDLNSSERQAIPLVADDLARNATALLVDGEW